jgi:hypothetical protein
VGQSSNANCRLHRATLVRHWSPPTSQVHRSTDRCPSNFCRKELRSARHPPPCTASIASRHRASPPAIDSISPSINSLSALTVPRKTYPLPHRDLSSWISLTSESPYLSIEEPYTRTSLTSHFFQLGRKTPLRRAQKQVPFTTMTHSDTSKRQQQLTPHFLQRAGCNKQPSTS